MTPVLPKSPRPAKARAKATLPSARRKPASPKPQALDSNAIGERIADAISSHRLQPGTKLGEEALGEIFGVSRTKVRQALFQLSAEKLVTLIPGRGAFVAQPSVSEAKGVFEARRVVEAAIVARFIEVATRADIENLAEHVQEEGRAVAAGSAQSRNRLLGDFIP
jgi:DNA-binding GntR family transcriptional regulator